MNMKQPESKPATSARRLQLVADYLETISKDLAGRCFPQVYSTK